MSSSDDRAKRYLRGGEVYDAPKQEGEDDKGDKEALDEEVDDGVCPIRQLDFGRRPWRLQLKTIFLRWERWRKE